MLDSHLAEGARSASTAPEALREAWGDLFSLNNELVRSRVRRALRGQRLCPFEVEGLCHETWMNALRCYPGMPSWPQGDVHRMLSTIARNAVYGYLRKGNHAAEEPSPNEEGESLLDWIATEEDLPFKVASREEQVFILRECLLMLDPSERELIHERYFKQATFETLAERQGVDESTLRKRCLKAQERLRCLLIEKGLSLSQISRTRSA